MDKRTEVTNVQQLNNGPESIDVNSTPSVLSKRVKGYLTFENECHRKNFIQSCCVYFNFILLGWTYGQLGTAFPDLQLILNTNVEQTSLVFTMNSVGYMAGSVGIGFVYDRVSHLKLLGVLSVVNGVTSIVLPWCKLFGLFLAVRFIDGFLCGGRDAGGNAKVASCWGTEGRQYMQALHFTYALGGIISPLVTSLFLAPRIHIPSTENITFENVTYSSDDRSENTTTDFLGLKPVDDAVLYGETKVHIAFVITGLLTSFSGLHYILLYRQGYDKIPPYSKPIQEQRVSPSTDLGMSRVNFTRTQRFIFIVVLGVSVVSYSTVECKYQSFIMPFVQMQLNWGKSKGAHLISLLWAFYGIGRFAGIFISRFLVPSYLLISFLGMVIIASCGMCIASYFLIDAVVWIMVPLAGFGISVIFPTFIVWTQENALKISGKMGGFFLFVGALGFFIDPLYIGVLMENVSPMYFNYLNIGEGLFAIIIFLILLYWIGLLRKQNTT
ncbi:sodium-dependent glucose transporter 1A-like [Mercenaria mercenaria]|uniref:sodium-dependent glucose transporter 1A-like n=1 Tax=Mercenaria mercenaria TaxID=6596 RepID=UPI00234F6EFF|nr:sodium-dependent glucose transporter 1A-like [Mercenaria mercenaria]